MDDPKCKARRSAVKKHTANNPKEKARAAIVAQCQHSFGIGSGTLPLLIKLNNCACASGISAQCTQEKERGAGAGELKEISHRSRK